MLIAMLVMPKNLHCAQTITFIKVITTGSSQEYL